MTEGRLDPVVAARLARMSPAKRALFLKSAGLPPEVADRVSSAERGGIERRAPGAEAPLSFAQELLWLLQGTSAEFAAYNAPRTYRIRGPVNVEALVSALDAHVARHEVYRMAIRASPNGPVQQAMPPRPVEVRVSDIRAELATLDAGGRDDRIAEFIRNAVRESFNLERDQLLRVSLFRTDDAEHVLVLVSHHIASDGWSRGIMFREIAEFYDAALAGRQANLPPVPVQYGDYAAWQRQHLSGNRLATLLDYWREQLAGAPAALELPTDRPRPTVPRTDGDRVRAVFPAELADRLKSLARTRDATLFMTMLAAWHVLLSRYSGQTDVLVGTPIAGRIRPELEGLVGYFADTLVIRASLDDAPTFANFLDRVRTRTLGAFDHQEVPYEKLALELAGERGGAMTPLFQSLFVMHDDRAVRLSLSGTTVETLPGDGGWTKSDVGLSVSDRPDGLSVTLEYRTDLFDRERMQRMIGHLRTLLEGIVAAPDTPVNLLPILTKDEREQLTQWNATGHSFSSDRTIIDLIECTADTLPGFVAMQVGDTTMTLADIERRANQLAHRLRREGVREGVGVALCLQRSFDLVISLLAAMKAGGHYVPLDPDYPAERLGYMLSDSGARVVLTDATRRAVLPANTAARMIELDTERASIDSESDVRLQSGASPDSLAYVIYTSGSTGRPKGVMIPHRAVVNHVEWMQRTVGLTALDCVLQKAPASFDVSVWEFFLPLVVGARLLLARPGGHHDPDYLLQTIAEQGVTVMQFVPSQLQIVLETPGAEALGKLRLLVLAGEALPGDMLARCERVAPTAILNGYGPTEATVYATSWAHDARVDGRWDGSAVPIGRPVDNTRVHIVEPRSLQQQPVGVPGELLIGGVQVARGYHGQKELTAEKFIDDPFTSPHGEVASRLYRTGDLARRRPDGVLEYLGRIDNQVKVRGYRIELGEIEEALTRHPAVRQSVVTLREDTPGDKRLVAYVAFESGASESPDALRAFLRSGLPDYMVPAAVVVLDAIPLTANGKANRAALPPPDVVERVAASYAPPRTLIEHELVQIWSALFPARQVGIHDDFFDIGGHSLLALRMLAEIERMRGRRVPLALLFESSTIEELAAWISGEIHAEREPPLVVLQAQRTGTPFAFAHADARGGGWYCRRLAPLATPDSPFYVLSTVSIDGEWRPWTIEAMATVHVAELRKVQPRGPYRVGGFCSGGLVAFEMACQLQDAGEIVERLVIVDSAAVNVRVSFFRQLLRLVPGADANVRLTRQAVVMKRVRWYELRLRQIRREPLGVQWEWVVTNVARRLRRITGGSDTGLPATPVSETRVQHEAQTSEFASALRTEIAAGPGTNVLLMQSRAAAVFFPRFFKGTIDFIWADERADVRRRDPTLGWGRRADRVRLQQLQSSHLGLVTDRLPMFADAIRSALERGDE